jgi:YidC/Oxa1 family membrane protein insertase
VLIVLYVGTQLAASAVTAISADPMQRRIMFALPFVFVIFIVNFEAGLIVYWITTNVWTIGQQLLVKKLYPKPALAGAGAVDAGDGGKPARGKPPSPKAAPAAASGNGSGDDAGSKEKAKTGAAGGQAKAPPQSPRKKKKRSGRRR